jgi:hypothetical protein
MTKIKSTDTWLNASKKIAMTDPLARTVLNQFIEEYPDLEPDNPSNNTSRIGVDVLCLLDEHGIYGHDIVRLYNKCQHRNDRFLHLLRAAKLDVFSSETLKAMAQNDNFGTISNQEWINIVEETGEELSKLPIL